MAVFVFILTRWLEKTRIEETMKMVKRLKTPNQAVKSIVNGKDGTTVEFYEPKSSETNNLTKVS